MKVLNRYEEEYPLEELRKKKWVVMAKKADFAAIADHFHMTKKYI